MDIYIIVVYYMEMVIKMDKQGRILIPISVRKRVKTNIFLLKIVNDEIRLKPVKAVPLDKLVDSIEVEVNDFTDTHKLRRALVE